MVINNKVPGAHLTFDTQYILFSGPEETLQAL